MITRTPTVFVPALLCDDTLYRDVIDILGDTVQPQVLLSPQSRLADSVADILVRAPATFALVGASYGTYLALEIALAAPQRVSSLWLMGCDGSPPREGGPDIAAGLETTPQAVIDLLAGLVVRPTDQAAVAAFKLMAQRIGGHAGAAQARAIAGRSAVMPRLSELRMPTLVMSGDEDPIAPPDAVRHLAESMSNARFRLIDQCGHLPTLEQPAQAAAQYQTFLNDCLKAGSKH